jgi:hypothetical protein
LWLSPLLIEKKYEEGETHAVWVLVGECNIQASGPTKSLHDKCSWSFLRRWAISIMVDQNKLPFCRTMIPMMAPNKTTITPSFYLFFSCKDKIEILKRWAKNATTLPPPCRAPLERITAIKILHTVDESITPIYIYIHKKLLNSASYICLVHHPAKIKVMN